VFDPAVLRNGVHEIQLYAEDISGNGSVAESCVIADGGLKVGQVTLSFADMSFAKPGFPLSFGRQYDSRSQTPGDFGQGWSLPQKEVGVATTGVMGEGWTQVRGSTGHMGLLTTHTLMPMERRVVAVRFSDTDVLRFEMDVTPNPSRGLPFEHNPPRVVFRPLDGTQGTLRPLDVEDEVSVNDGLIMGHRGTDIFVYNPGRFELTRPDGTVYVISTGTGIERMTDSHGHTVDYDEGGVHHTSRDENGEVRTASIGFERDDTGRIRRITGPDGRETEYHYDENGMLEKVIQVGEGSPTDRMLSNYAYAHGAADRPLIKEIKAPDGTVLGSFEYDTAGRMVAMTDGGNNRILYGFDVPNHRQDMKDRRGNITRYEYDGEGNVTRREDPLGNVTVWAYDDDGNKLSETNPSGHTTEWTYDDRGNMLTETDPIGNTASYTYNERNQVLKKTGPLGHVTTKSYDDKGNLTETTDALGRKTIRTYDPRGLLSSVRDSGGNLTKYVCDYDGNVVREFDPPGNVTVYDYTEDGYEKTAGRKRTAADGSEVVMTVTKAYDSMNRITKETGPDGYFTETEYDPVTGKKSLSRDRNGNVTTYGYDGQGNLLSTTYPGGKTISHTYDPDGNALSTMDRGGNTTEYAYNPLDQATKITHPDNATVLMDFDAGGLRGITDERVNMTSFEWNAAGKRTKITDALGNVTKLGYDANGNQIRMTDAEGRTTLYEYDALNRRIRTIFPDGTFTEVTYYGDGEDRKMSETDQAGKVTRFGYDAAGRLAKVTDALGGETTYEYDEVSNRISQTDPNGNTKYWEYDNLGRVTRHMLPDGKSESYVYDPNGNLIEKTDFNGDTVGYEYDGYNRLTKKAYPDGSEVSFTYTDNGRRKTVTDVRGVTGYEYDSLNRLKKVTDPDGTEISYTYDAKGNRTSVTVPSGRTDYTYDDLNRLGTVTDPDGGVTAYTYDKVGNRKSVTYPNGVAAEYMYDRLHRLIRLTNRNAAGDLISGYIYTLGPAGNREQVEELHSGRVVKYSYDELHRLTAEEITDPVLGNETISYGYDAFGNRLAKGSSGGTISYSYNENDELGTENDLSHGYDDNGNAVSRDGVIFGYDYENRLVSAGSVGYTYDADGIRVSSVAGGSATDYLVDKNRQYAQVLEERNGGSSVSYVHGDDLISRKQGGEIRYYVYDGHGSVRHLTDADGTVTDSYIYDAFGNLKDHLGDSDNRYLYAGEQYDPDAGLYYLRARYYDPGSGRFMTHDPHPGNPDEPVTLHRYLYAGTNPVMYGDPSGEFMSLSEAGAAFVTVTTLNMLWSQSTAFLAHLASISMNREPFVWSGVFGIGHLAAKKGVSPGLGAMAVGLYSVKRYSEDESKSVNAAYFVLFPFGFSIGGSGASLTYFDIYTPGLMGTDPDVLQGPALYMTASVTAGKGRGFPSWLSKYSISLVAGTGGGGGYTVLYMGTGLSAGFSPIIGHDTGTDMLTGFCFKVWGEPAQQ